MKLLGNGLHSPGAEMGLPPSADRKLCIYRCYVHRRAPFYQIPRLQVTATIQPSAHSWLDRDE